MHENRGTLFHSQLNIILTCSISIATILTSSEGLTLDVTTDLWIGLKEAFDTSQKQS